jgi:integrase
MTLLANRVLSMVKALLNHAMRDPSNGLTDDSAWRFVKPFHGVSKQRDIRYTDEEVRRLVDSAGDASLANLITGAYLTGARYGELSEARVSHFDTRTNFTASQTFPQRVFCDASFAAGTSRQVPHQSSDQSAAHGCDRVRDVALGS